MAARESEPTEAALTERALRLLGTREHSRFELRRKLLRGRATDGAESTWVDPVLDDLTGRGLLSDVRFAESFVRRGVDRGHGPLKIRAGLRTRGVAENIIDDTLTFSDEFWLVRARAAQAKRFGSVSNDGGGGGGGDGGDNAEARESNGDDAPVNRAEWAKRARFLAGRGFASDIIYRTLGPQTV